MSDSVDDLAGIAADTLRLGRARRVTVKSVINVEPGQIDVLATAGEDALIAAKLPVFQRGGRLVRPAAWSVPASDERTTLAADTPGREGDPLHRARSDRSRPVNDRGRIAGERAENDTFQRRHLWPIRAAALLDVCQSRNPVRR